MKFKWIGGNGFKDIDLVLAGIMKPDEQLFNGTIIDIPDSNEGLLHRIQINGNYEVYAPSKKVNKLPKIKKDKNEKKEDK